MTNWFLLLLIFVITACGTITREKDFIPVDSSPRTMDVYEGEQYVGTTPFFMEVKRQHKKEFSFFHTGLAQGESNPGEKYTYDCNINWTQSVIPNSIFVVSTSAQTALIFAGVDLLSGSFFQCQNPIYFKSERRAAYVSGVNLKRKIMVLPVFNADEFDSFESFEKWRVENFKNTSDELFDYKETQTRFKFFGINHELMWTPDKINKKNVWYLGHKYQASHLMYFDVRRKDYQTIVLQPHLVDMFTLKEEENSEIEYLRPSEYKSVDDSQNPYLRLFKKSFTLIPNSFLITLPVGNDFVYYDKTTYPETIHSKAMQNHHRALPTIVTMWGLENIKHPNMFDTWDYTFKLSPSVNASAWEKSFKLANNHDYFIEMRAFNATLDAGVVAFTPWGSFALAYGLGPMYYLGSDNHGSKYSNMVSVSKLDLSWYAFVRERYYFKISISEFNSGTTMVNNELLYSHRWITTSITLGYFIPEMGFFIRNNVQKAADYVRQTWGEIPLSFN